MLSLPWVGLTVVVGVSLPNLLLYSFIESLGLIVKYETPKEVAKDLNPQYAFLPPPTRRYDAMFYPTRTGLRL